MSLQALRRKAEESILPDKGSEYFSPPPTSSLDLSPVDLAHESSTHERFVPVVSALSSPTNPNLSALPSPARRRLDEEVVQRVVSRGGSMKRKPPFSQVEIDVDGTMMTARSKGMGTTPRSVKSSHGREASSSSPSSQAQLIPALRIPAPAVIQSPSRMDSTLLFYPDTGTRVLRVGKDFVLSKPIRHSETLSASSSPRKRCVQDYKTLASACQRAGKIRQEGYAYFSMGVLYDNSSQFTKAIASYKKFLNISRRIGDTKCEALALNSLGLSFMALDSETDMREAIEFHIEHGEITDEPGRYVAHSNLGLAYSFLEMFEESVRHYQYALQYAVQLNHLEAESMALMNLAITSRKIGDLNTAKACIERHLELCESLRDDASRSIALQELGRITLDLGALEEASTVYEKSLEASRELGEQRALNSVKCRLAVSVVNNRIEDMMRDIGSRLHGDDPMTSSGSPSSTHLPPHQEIPNGQFHSGSAEVFDDFYDSEEDDEDHEPLEAHSLRR